MSLAGDDERVRSIGVVTVAYLKAQMDSGSDHLGIFMPLVLDVLMLFDASTFVPGDVQMALADRHGIAMPVQAIETLLRRAKRQGVLVRDSGRYKVVKEHVRRLPPVQRDMESIRHSQLRLGGAFMSYAAKRRITLESEESALDVLYTFFKNEQVTLLLGAPQFPTTGGGQPSKHRAVCAEFVQEVLKDDPDLTGVLRSILEGMVLYHAAFLPDLGERMRSFNGLIVAFDSVLIRQALGYEGAAMRALLRPSLDLLKAGGATCVVFDKTLHEIRRILAMYEYKLGSWERSRTLNPVPMARHFLTQRYSPSDVRQMIALLEREVQAAGFEIRRCPDRLPQFTAGEALLAKRLSDPNSEDEWEPRVQHDVDCVAAILSLRRGHRATRLEEARAIFVTSSPLVIRNTRLWYTDDEREVGIEPVIHFRALVNLAWLKKPVLCVDYKERELVALCSVVLRPSRDTWERFLRHLEALEASGALDSAEVVAIVTSSMSDHVLREVEDDESGDPDALTLDDAVERVKQKYAAAADERADVLQREYEARLADAEARARVSEERSDVGAVTEESLDEYRDKVSKLEKELADVSGKAERARRGELRRDAIARSCARYGSILGISGLRVVAVLGAVGSMIGFPFRAGWLGFVFGIPVVIYVLLDILGILSYTRHLQTEMESRLTQRIRTLLGGEG